MKNKIGTASDWLRNHKVLGLCIGLLVLGVVGIFLYTSVRTTSDRAITEGQNELEAQTEDVEKQVKKESKDLDFKVPMVEDIANAIIEQEELDGQLDLEQKESFINDEYGSEVLFESLEGTLPSQNLTKSQNKQQLDTIKQHNVEGYTSNTGAWELNTSEFVFNDDSITSYPKQVSLEKGYTLENQSQFFNIGDYSVGGIHVDTYSVDTSDYALNYNPETPIMDVKSSISMLSSFDVSHDYLNTLGNENTMTVINYFVRSTDEKEAVEMLKDTLEVPLTVNGTETLALNKNEQDTLIFDSMFGELSYPASDEETVQASNIFLVRQFIPGTALKESNNKISIQGSEYQLKKVKPNDVIDLTETYSE